MIKVEGQDLNDKNFPTLSQKESDFKVKQTGKSKALKMEDDEKRRSLKKDLIKNLI